MPTDTQKARSSADRIYFLTLSVDFVNGIARTVNNLANRLVEDHAVEIISVDRRRDEPAYPVDPRVTVSYLADARRPAPAGEVHRISLRANGEPLAPRLSRWLDARPSRLGPSAQEPQASTLTDVLLWRRLRTLDPGILIPTRPSLIAAAVRMAPSHVITIGQDHLNFETRGTDPGLVRLLRRSGARLDAMVVLTRADAADYARAVAGGGTLVVPIPNALPWPVEEEPTAPRDPVVVAAGRLVEQKGFDRLIPAYAPVARRHPDWQLHIYGRGRDRKLLQRLIRAHGLQGTVILKGYTDQMEGVLRTASIYAMTSRYEGFPMALLEAMGKGLPLVSFDCPRGPAEMVEDGRNGRLVPDGDVEGFSQALSELIEDADLRARMGSASRADARRYEIDPIAAEWETLFERVATRRWADT